MNLLQKKTKIIIADDHEIFRLGLLMTLKGEDDFEVVAQANNGKELVELATTIFADLVITDQMMPSMSGIDALKEIKLKRPSVKTILFTVIEDQHLLESVKEIGVDGYLLKSQMKTHIVDAIRLVFAGEKVLPSSRDAVSEPVVGQTVAENPFADLTPKEMKVLQLLTLGKTYKQTADALGVSVKTVEYHRAGITEKIGKKSIAELTRMALSAGLIIDTGSGGFKSNDAKP